LAIGALFALGLGLSGMTQPAKVLGFLDVAGAWDPTLLYVMGSAVVVNFIGFRLTAGRPHPVLAARFDVPSRRDIDVPLVAGAAVFGLGWGLAGFCPGPALVALASGSFDVFIFVVAMFAGFVLKDVLIRPAVPPQRARQQASASR
jgi:uncharacterized membrane protein YedE/YeeE